MTPDEKLAAIAKLICDIKEPKGWSQNPCDDSGGNYDDAYSLGVDYGEQLLADQIRGILNRNI